MFLKHRWMLTLMFLLGALACYAAGMVQGAVVLFCLGLALEAWFWVRVFDLDHGRRNDPPLHESKD